ncbi:MAG TPA: ATP-binding protein [Vicinamibacterales bacterium]
MDVSLNPVDDQISAIAADELAGRRSRPADHAAESAALVAMARELAASPQTILARLAERALDLCRAHSAGFSLLDDERRHFEWTGVAGVWAQHLGGGTPRDFGPCGMVLEAEAPLLFWHPERRFPYLAATTPTIDEGLLLPFYVGGRAVGTIWIISHDDTRRFDAEDLRVMTSLATFASAAYQAQRESDHRYREILNSLPAAVYTTDAQGRVTHFNRAAAEIAGRTPQVGVDRWCVTWKLLRSDGQPIAHDDCAMAAAVLEGRSIHGTEVVIERPDGSRVDVMAYPTPLRDASGRITGGINVMVDVTDRKQLIAQLQAQDGRKDEFLATLAHELRNPLAPVANCLQLMRRAGGNPSILDHARTIMERQLAQMVRLVDDLLDLSRITRNRLELRKERVPLSKIVDSAIETSRPIIDQAAHALDVALPPAPVLVDADPIRLAQAIANLLNNAAKYSEPGRTITLAADLVDDGVVVRVRDQGIGIPREKLAEIFEMFMQVDASLERARGGLGIGLTLVRRLVELHGGTIEAHSDGPGRGSEFIIRLPVAAPASGRTGEDPATLGEARPERRRVLVVDDNRDAAESLAEILRMLGHEVVTAYEGREGLDRVATFKPDIALLDLGMPRMNGYEVARTIRSRNSPGPLLVAVTGWGQEADRLRSQEAGFDLHLVKPVDVSVLEEIFRTRVAVQG